MVQAYDNTTLLVSDIHGFSDIVTKAAPTQAFGMVNAMCAAFDALVTKNKCFRVGNSFAVFNLFSVGVCAGNIFYKKTWSSWSGNMKCIVKLQLQMIRTELVFW